MEKEMSIKAYRIWAIVLRYMRESFRDIFVVADYLYWPIMDIFMWGMMTVWLAEHHQNPSALVLVVLSGLVFWHIVYQANIEIAKNILDEFWSQNLINLFSSPLTVYEWLIAVMIMGAMRMFFTVLIGFLAVWFFYALNIFSLGYALVPFAASLLMTGWFMGILTAAIILYGGMRTQWLAWAAGWLLAPFSSVFYSVDLLPRWGQIVARCLPTTYVFEGMREVLLNDQIPYNNLIISFCLNSVYLMLAFFVFVHMFEKSRTRGLARLE
jgi:ABC-2 type transport system permease protein